MFRAIKSTVKEHHRWIITAAGCMAIGSSQDAVYADVCIPPLSKSDFKKKYQVEREIGFGGYSRVMLAVEKATGKELAIKFFDPGCASVADIQHEVHILERLGSHPNIVNLNGYFHLPDRIIMLMECVAGGELFDYIISQESISESVASELLRQVCIGLRHMHHLDVSHRDIKPENILLSKASKDANVKIADFGLSRVQQNGEKLVCTKPTGTWAYWAPEIVLQKPQDFAVDMWAFGLLVYIVLMGYHPFDPSGTRTDAEIIAEIADGQYDVASQWYQEISPSAKDFIKQLLVKDPTKRLTADEALEHPWLKGEANLKSPLSEGHAARLQAFRRLEELRANVFAVIIALSSPKEGFLASENARRIEKSMTANQTVMRSTFDLFDKDSSGYISKDEFAQVLAALGQSPSRDDLDQMMKSIDVDGDGRVSFEEFASMMQQCLFTRGHLSEKDLQAAFRVFDKNRDGYISVSELMHVMSMLGHGELSRKQAEDFIATADLNGDGKIEYSEFAKMMSNIIT